MSDDAHGEPNGAGCDGRADVRVPPGGARADQPGGHQASRSTADSMGPALPAYARPPDRWAGGARAPRGLEPLLSSPMSRPGSLSGNVGPDRRPARRTAGRRDAISPLVRRGHGGGDDHRSLPELRPSIKGLPGAFVPVSAVRIVIDVDWHQSLGLSLHATAAARADIARRRGRKGGSQPRTPHRCVPLPSRGSGRRLAGDSIWAGSGAYPWASTVQCFVRPETVMARAAPSVVVIAPRRRDRYRRRASSRLDTHAPA